jgi:hypothetical protein
MKDGLKLTESVTMTIESNHLYNSSINKVSRLLSKECVNRNDLIDIFVGLHLILELGINNIFRKIILPSIKKQIGTHKIFNNLDNISFLNKIVMFVYYSKFNFPDNKKATEYHKIIGTLRNFSQIRNKLFHGHSITEISKNGNTTRSSTMEKLDTIVLKNQIKDFKFIIKGMRYYVDCFDTTITSIDKDKYKKSFLMDDFIPSKIPDFK